MPESVFIGTAKGTVNYQDVSFSVVAKLNPREHSQWFYLMAGISNLFNIGRSQTIVLDNQLTGEVVKTGEDLINDGRKFSSWNLRGDIGFGFEWKAFGQSHFFVEPVFGYNFFPVISEGDGKYGQYSAGVNVGLVTSLSRKN